MMMKNYALPDGLVKMLISNVLTLVLSVTFFSGQSFAQGVWVPVTATAPNTNAGVMLLLTDGTVLCKTSGGGGQGTVWNRLKPNANGSYINGTWSTIAAMANDRLYFSTQVLRDGRVYVCGGEYGAGGSAGEVYDPVTNVWTPCPLTSFFVSDANSVMLPDGRVLQACVGSGTRHTRIWDPATNTYSLGPDCLRTDNEAAWLKLPDNSILFIDNYGTSSERYIPATNTWVNDGTVPVSVYDPFGDEAGAAFLLPDGRGFFLGSSGHNAYYTPSGSTVPGTWAAGPDFPAAQGTPDAPAAMMANGKILCAVSPIPITTDHFPMPTSFYEFDYTTNTFTALGAPGGGTTLPISVYITNMLCLPDGTVLYSRQGSNRYYEYVPTGTPLAAGKPTVNGIYRISCDTFMATGTLFNGITEGAGYGDDWQMNTNYPIIRLTSGANVYYTKTYNWNRTGVMTGALPDTTKFILPAGLPVGTYTLEVVVNGNPSASVSINTSLAISPSPLTVCSGTSTTLTDVWAGGTWSSANTSIATVDPVTGMVGGAGAGTTLITYTLGACFSTSSVTVITSPAAITPAGPVTVCAGGSTGLSDAVAGGTWSSSNTAVATVNSSGIVTGASQGVVTINYNGCGSPATKVVTVKTTPAPIAGNSTVCFGGGATTTILSDASTGGTWSSSNSAVGTISSAGFVLTSASQGTTTISYSNGCGSAATQAVTVNAVPGVISGSNTLCFGGGTTALSNTSNAGAWSSNNTSVASVNTATGLVTGGVAGAATISYANGCGAAATIPITVNPGPAAPGPITGTTTVCQGAITALSDATPGGAWSSGSPLIAGVSVTGVVSGTSGGTAIISYSMTNICGSTSATSTVTVNPLPAPATITGTTTTFCEGTTIALSDATPGGIWSSNITTIATVSATGVVTGVSGGNSTIFYAVTNGCGTIATTLIIDINPLPVLAGITGFTSVCKGSTVSLNDITPGGVWSISNTSIATISGAGTVTGINTGSAIVSYSATNGCGTSSSTIAVAVITVPAPGPITGADSVCQGHTIQLSDVIGGGVWSSDYATIANVGGTGVVLGFTAGVDSIRHKVVNACGTGTTAKGIVVLSSSSLSCIPSTGNAIAEQKPTGLKVFPNPNGGTFTVLLSSASNEQVLITIINSVGEKVKEFVGNTNENAELKLNTAPGIYFVSAITKDGRYLEKVVVSAK